MTDTPIDLLALTTQITSAYLLNNQIPAGQLPEVIRAVHSSLNSLGAPVEAPAPELKPAVPIKKSITPDYIVCLEDGAQLKMLRRYIRSRFGMTPEEYRQKWGLPPDYPMTAPNYAQQRSTLAKNIGLGRRMAPAEPEPAPPTPEPKRRGRKKADA